MMDAYFYPVLGGVLIGLAATASLLLLGKLAGISGIAWGALTAPRHDRSWRYAFLLGLVAGALLFHWLTGKAMPVPDGRIGLALLAGLLVGFGVKLGNGCTSGHGVCGLGRRSLRSLAATLTFMATGIVTVYLLRHVLGGGL